MATVVLDVPEEKVHSFVKMVLQLGIDKHRISSSSKKNKSSFIQSSSPAKPSWFSIFSPLAYRFDWDSNRNELEFE
jgi:hypothetical protein